MQIPPPENKPYWFWGLGGFGFFAHKKEIYDLFKNPLLNRCLTINSRGFAYEQWLEFCIGIVG